MKSRGSTLLVFIQIDVKQLHLSLEKILNLTAAFGIKAPYLSNVTFSYDGIDVR